MNIKDLIRPINGKSLSLIFLVIISIALTIFRFSNISTKEISWDVFGYYLPLPATFIYEDPLLNDKSWIEDLNREKEISGTLYQITYTPSGEPVYLFLFGMSVFYFIFFWAGHWHAGLTGFPQNGFSEPYQYSLIAGGIIFTIIGLIYFRKVLLKFFDDKTTLWILIIITLGTNYAHQMSLKNLETVNVLFMLASVMLWHTIRWHENYKLSHLLGIGIPIGLMALIKPSEILIVALPLLYNTYDKELRKEKWAAIRKHWKHFLLLAFLGLLIIMPQLLYWKVRTGNFLHYSYENPGVGLDFTNPHFYNSMFSLRKGWLVYTPLMAFALIGFITLFRKNRNLFRSIFFPFLISFYVLVSWSEWHYGGGFSNRPVITYYPLLSIPLGYFLTELFRRGLITRIITYTVIVLLLLLNQFQWWQFRNYIIDPYRMTPEYYQAVFLKCSFTDDDRKLLLVDRSFDGAYNFNDKERYDSRVLLDENFDDEGFLVDAGEEFTLAHSYPFRDIVKSDHAWLEFEIDFRSEDTGSVQNPLFIVTISRRNGNYAYHANELNPDGVAKGRLHFCYLTPEVRRRSDKVQFYIWNRDRSEIIIDRLNVKLYERVR